MLLRITVTLLHEFIAFYGLLTQASTCMGSATKELQRPESVGHSTPAGASQSRDKRRNLVSHPKLRSTTQRLDHSTNPSFPWLTSGFADQCRCLGLPSEPDLPYSPSLPKPASPSVLWLAALARTAFAPGLALVHRLA